MGPWVYPVYSKTAGPSQSHSHVMFQNNGLERPSDASIGGPNSGDGFVCFSLLLQFRFPES